MSVTASVTGSVMASVTGSVTMPECDGVSDGVDVGVDVSVGFGAVYRGEIGGVTGGRRRHVKGWGGGGGGRHGVAWRDLEWRNWGRKRVFLSCAERCFLRDNVLCLADGNVRSGGAPLLHLFSKSRFG